jgi:hypothetical protein
MAKAGILTLAASRALNHCRLPMLRLKRRLSYWTSDLEPGFFDSYPRFYSTSQTGAKPNRLNKRHRALIDSNEAIIRGKSVLDSLLMMDGGVWQPIGQALATWSVLKRANIW